MAMNRLPKITMMKPREIEEAEEGGPPNTAVPPSNPIHHCTAESGGSDYTECTMKKAGIGKIMKHAVKKVKITARKRTVQAGITLKLKATVTTTGKSANKTLKWTSSNTKYATVSKSGKVKAKQAGKEKKVTITAMATDGSGKKAKVKIKIK